MSLLEMVRHYTSALVFNEIRRVIARWEEYTKVTEWGYYWEGGYLLEDKKGRIIHFYGWRYSAQPWEDESRVKMKYFKSIKRALEEKQRDWQLYPLKRTE